MNLFVKYKNHPATTNKWWLVTRLDIVKGEVILVEAKSLNEAASVFFEDKEEIKTLKFR